MAGRTARSRLDGTAARKGSCSESGRTPRRRLPKARPVAVMTPRWRAERRRIFPKGRCAIDYLTRLLGAPSPRFFAGVDSPDPPVRGTKWDNGVPGAAKNTGDVA